MKNLKKFEEHTIVKKSELGDNWSAEYKINIKKGLKPYTKNKGLFTEVDSKKSIPKNVVYLKPEQAKKYNSLGEKIAKMQKEQEDIIK